MTKRLSFTIGGKVYHAKMENNVVAEQIASLCPFEQEYKRFAGHEYCARLAKPVSQDGCVEESCPRRNKIYYFHDWNALTLLYGDGDLTQFGTTVVHIGDTEGDAASVLEHSPDAVKILCEVDNA